MLTLICVEAADAAAAAVEAVDSLVLFALNMWQMLLFVFVFRFLPVTFCQCDRTKNVTLNGRAHTRRDRQLDRLTGWLAGCLSFGQQFYGATAAARLRFCNILKHELNISYP